MAQNGKNHRAIFTILRVRRIDVKVYSLVDKLALLDEPNKV